VQQSVTQGTVAGFRLHQSGSVCSRWLPVLAPGVIALQ
jgi:hypothetical protein